MFYDVKVSWKRLVRSFIGKTSKGGQKSTSSGKVEKETSDESKCSSTEEEEDGSQILGCVWSTSISESPLQQKSMDPAKHTPQKEQLQLQREKTPSIDTFVSPILTKRNRLSLPSDRASIKQKVRTERMCNL